jgi:alkylhydroperoxidase family enzyme
MNTTDSPLASPGRRCLAAVIGLTIGTILSSSVIAEDGPGRASNARVPLLSSEDAWKRLPPQESGGGQPLPSWAKALAGAMPYTTAATLELDRTYRTSDALDPKLAGSIRFMVARTLRSEYGMAYAESDLQRAGMDQAAIDRLKGDRSTLSAAERAALAFAERMTTAGYATTDDEVAGLVASFGETKVVAIVLQIAYANFLDRMALALGLTVEPGGPVAPVDVRFARPSGSGIPAASRPAAVSNPEAQASAKFSDPDWATFNYDQLQEKLEAQRGRKPRVSIPTWEEFREVLPESLYPRAKPLRIRWSLLVSGRQPKLGPAWIKCLRTFEEEAKQDRVFEESLFWVVTRSLRCFYCMGHCEMLLGVAGLDQKAIADRTAKLAGDDWSSFPPAERVGFAFARKLTRTPWEVDDADIRKLVDAFGPERALDVVFWSSRCQFMTKVSDAFQLQLERENVFQDRLPPKDGPK